MRFVPLEMLELCCYIVAIKVMKCFRWHEVAAEERRHVLSALPWGCGLRDAMLC